MSKDKVIDLLQQRGVAVDDITLIVYELQKPYHEQLTMEQCTESVLTVLEKREVQYTLYTGIALDELAERGLLPSPLQQVMEVDEPLYGADETLALGITHMYGMIGLTSFGYLDKVKHGIIKRLNDRSTGEIHVFLDDLVAGIAAAASARLAHNW